MSGPVRRDWLIHLIGIASKHFFSHHIIKITIRNIFFGTFEIKDISLAVKSQRRS